MLTMRSLALRKWRKNSLTDACSTANCYQLLTICPRYCPRHSPDDVIIHCRFPKYFPKISPRFPQDTPRISPRFHTWYLSFLVPCHIFQACKRYAKKVQKFATKIAPQQNSLNKYFEILINILQIISISGISWCFVWCTLYFVWRTWCSVLRTWCLVSCLAFGLVT